ncbi:MAG TPA: hypothetical protein EYH31_00110 [Anaerolineae bacterium]|nr:hypothetical protein [Anaerolineae bacterium]
MDFVRRLLGLLAAAVVLVVFVSITVRLTPGGPFDVSANKSLPPPLVRALKEKYRLDEPLWQQFAHYVGDLLRGDLGPSFRLRNRAAADLLANWLPTALQLLGWALSVMQLMPALVWLLFLRLVLFAFIQHRPWTLFAVISLGWLLPRLAGLISEGWQARPVERSVVTHGLGLVAAALAWGAAGTTLMLGALGFLGVGMSPPAPELGMMIAESFRAFLHPHVLLSAATALILVPYFWLLLADTLLTCLGVEQRTAWLWLTR